MRASLPAQQGKGGASLYKVHNATLSRYPMILLDPYPRSIDLIFSAEDQRRLDELDRVIWHDGRKAPDAHIDKYLPQALALIGQTPMPRQRLERASSLRAIFNVEGNFLPNIDYEYCQRQNIHVLCCAPAFAPAVAEMAIALALDCARGITRTDAAFRQNSETYGGLSNKDSVLLRGKTVGLIGCGNLGRALLPLLRAFNTEILVHDPWLHDHLLTDLGIVPVSLENLLVRSQVVFVLATATTQNQKGLDGSHFGIMQKGAILVLLSRADVVEFDALLDAAASGHIRVAIDVFPEEPLPKNHRARTTANTILSAHRAGGLTEVFQLIGQMVVDDLELILRGLPPQRMQRAQLETVEQYRSKPIGK